MADRSDVRDILGFPFVPPAPLTRAVVAARRALGRAHRAAAPASLRVLESLFGLFDNRVLGLLVELDVPEFLDRPRTTGELAVKTGTSAEGLERLLRYAAGRGFLEWTDGAAGGRTMSPRCCGETM